MEQIRERLDDRFGLLTTGDRSAPPRQRTLRAAIEWSYDLLSEPERTLFRRLSVFAGWSLQMAEQICSDDQLPAPGPRGLEAFAALAVHENRPQRAVELTPSTGCGLAGWR